jgi:hypothetical protein
MLKRRPRSSRPLTCVIPARELTISGLDLSYGLTLAFQGANVSLTLTSNTTGRVHSIGITLNFLLSGLITFSSAEEGDFQIQPGLDPATNFVIVLIDDDEELTVVVPRQRVDPLLNKTLHRLVSA